MNASCRSEPCKGTAEYIIAYTEQQDNEGYATKILGSCSSCLEELEGSDFGYVNMYQKYPNFKLLTSIKDLKIYVQGVLCDRCTIIHDRKKREIRRANKGQGPTTPPISAELPPLKKATKCFVGLIKCLDGRQFHHIFYRCDEHKMEDGEDWRNLRIIKLK
jgi:hypothetical protein